MSGSIANLSRPRGPATAMVLAAGLGLRMRPITARLPKPLIEVGGRSLLERILDRLAEHGIERAIVNTHHLGHLIAERLAGRTAPRVVLSPETTPLETGGGVVNALPLLGREPFFVVNGDVLWRDDGRTPALAALALAWDAARMDALLLLHPVATAIGYRGAGDFLLDGDGRPQRRGTRPSAPFLFAGLQILHPRLFAGAPAEAFSLNRVFDRAIERERLSGVVHRGGWCHVGTPEDIPLAEAFLEGPMPPAAEPVALRDGKR
jgi:MurNAc alpha-1-phosphate uridylyltransferase